MSSLDRIRQNQERFDALGLKHISTSLKDSSQSNCARKRRRSRASVVVNDDYESRIDDDDNDDESSNSVIHKVQ